MNAAAKNEAKTAEIERLKSQLDGVELRLAKINNIVSADIQFGKGEVAALRMLEARLDETIIELAETRNLRQTTSGLTPLNRAIVKHAQ